MRSLKFREAAKPARPAPPERVDGQSRSNIGSGNRLDFTVIGPDVNLTARIERFCRELDRSLIMSEAFAETLDRPMWEIGHFELRGFRRHQAVYALCQEGEQPCRPKPSLARA